MNQLRIWLAHGFLWFSRAFMRGATFMTPPMPPRDSALSHYDSERVEYGEAYEAPLSAQHYKRKRGGFISRAPMRDDSEGSE